MSEATTSGAGRGLRYLKVQWHHDDLESPGYLLSEMEDDFEVRKIEVFADGRAQYAGPDGASGDTFLSVVATPPDTEIESQEEFTLAPVDRDEFERCWAAAQRGRLELVGDARWFV